MSVAILAILEETSRGHMAAERDYKVDSIMAQLDQLEMSAPARWSSASGYTWDGIPFHTLFVNCRLATMDPTIPAPYGEIKEGALGVRDGLLQYVGALIDLPSMARASAVKEVDLGGRWVTPGLIECHTHIVFGGQRATEWEIKLQGATYEEVLTHRQHTSSTPP
jgi:hypothetical protein